MPDELPTGDDRSQLLAEIGIAPPEAPAPEPPLPEPAFASLPADPIPERAVEAPPPRPPSAFAQGRHRLCGGVMALSGAAWLGLGAATRSSLSLAVAALLLVPGLYCWLRRQ